MDLREMRFAVYPHRPGRGFADRGPAIMASAGNVYAMDTIGNRNPFDVALMLQEAIANGPFSEDA